MTGDWIKWTKGLARKPEVLEIAHRLGRSRHEVAGLLMEIWEWADSNIAPENASAECPGIVRMPSASCPTIDRIVSSEGLAEAMISVGWLSISNGCLIVPHFGRHNGKSAKRRALDAERKRATRSISVRNPSASQADKKRTREEKRREEEIHPPNPPEGGAVVVDDETSSRTKSTTRKTAARGRPTVKERMAAKLAARGIEG